MGKIFKTPLTSTAILNNDCVRTPVNKQTANIIDKPNKANKSIKGNYCEICNIQISNVSRHQKSKSHLKQRLISQGLVPKN